ncbi:MAG: prolyl oligopeptidase family serine peptidase [Gammaproteobacteria bacterium]|nr:prolyl oligopeptidase family serine peptidase [Gammaproteobacteria bacterium]
MLIRSFLNVLVLVAILLVGCEQTAIDHVSASSGYTSQEADPLLAFMGADTTALDSAERGALSDLLQATAMAANETGIVSLTEFSQALLAVEQETAAETLDASEQYAAAVDTSTAASAPQAVKLATITARDGTALKAIAIYPAHRKAGPLLVLPSSWTQSRWQFLMAAQPFAKQGYYVVSYATRGTYGSAGESTFAEEATVDDVSDVIDWALGEFDVIPGAIAAGGMSYGAGLSLLAAARDSRIKAVMAIAAWFDLYGAFVHQDSINIRSAAELAGVSNVVLSAETEQLLADLHAGRTERLASISAVRSPMNYLEQYARHQTAIFVSHSWEDQIFPVDDALAFYRRLQSPKVMQLDYGAHAAQESNGIAGFEQKAWQRAKQWLDHHLLGEPLPAGFGDIARPLNREQWMDIALDRVFDSQSLRAYLGPPNQIDQARFYDQPSEWVADFDASRAATQKYYPDWDADNPQSIFELFPGVSPSDIHAENGLVWKSAESPIRQWVLGQPVVKLSLAANRDTWSVYVYLYALAAGERKAIPLSHGVYTGQGRDRQIDIKLHNTFWALEPGDRLMLVVDGQDQQYRRVNSTGTDITVSSDQTQPATLSIPLVEGASIRSIR